MTTSLISLALSALASHVAGHFMTGLTRPKPDKELRDWLDKVTK